MGINKIKNVIDAMSKIVSINDEKKQELINKYSGMNDAEVIKELAQFSYQFFKEKQELYDYALTIIRNINPQICSSIEEMKTILNKMFSNEIEGNMSLKQNHTLVNESLVTITKLLNENGIDYYIVGALPCFIKTGQPLFRYHDDIDIMVNEDNLDKLSQIVASIGYKFNDDRFPTYERFQEMGKNKPPHTILAQNPNNEFHLGFFTFKRDFDNSITMTEYSHRIENDKVIVDLLERKFDQIGTFLRYDDIPIEYLGSSFKTSTIESVYNLKSYMRRPKDITDMQKLEAFVDPQKLEKLKRHSNQNIESYNIEKATQKHSR